MGCSACLPAPPRWRWEPGLLCCPELARLADGHPWLPGLLCPQQLATRVAAERGLPNRSTVCQMDRRAGRNCLLRAARWQAVSIPALARSPGRLGPKLRQAGRVLGSWDRQDFQVPAWPAALEWDSSESGEPQKLNPISGFLLLHLAGCHRGRDTVVTTHRHLLSTARTLRAGTQPRSPRELLGRGLGSAGTC